MTQFPAFSIENVIYQNITFARRVFAFAANEIGGSGKRLFLMVRRKIPLRSFPTPPPSVAPVRRNFRLIRPGKFNFLPSKALSKRPLCSVPVKNNGMVSFEPIIWHEPSSAPVTILISFFADTLQNSTGGKSKRVCFDVFGPTWKITKSVILIISLCAVIWIQ